MSGFTAADLEAASANVQQASTLIHENSNSTAKEDAGTVFGHFLHWLEFSQKYGRFFPTDVKPDIKAQGASSCYKLRAQFILDKMIPCDIFEETADDYRVLCFYYFKGHTLDFLRANAAKAWGADTAMDDESIAFVRSVTLPTGQLNQPAIDALESVEPERIEFARANAAKAWLCVPGPLDDRIVERIRSLVDADGEVICDRVLSREITNKKTKQTTTRIQYGVWRTIPKKATITAELITYNPGDISYLEAPVSNGQVPVRRFITCKLTTASPNLDVSQFFYKATGEVGLSIDAEPIFKYGGLSNQSVTVTIDRFAVLDEMARQTATFCKPFIDVLDEKEQVPYSIVFQMTPKAILYENRVMRTVVPTGEQGNYVKEDDCSIRLFSLFRDQYYNPEGTPFVYDLRFTTWSAECAAYGMDSNAWLAIMRRHQGLDAFVFANLRLDRSKDLDANNRAVLMARQPGDPHGTYVYNVTAVFPNYAKYLPEHAIELTGDEVIDLFKKTTKKRLDGRFAVSIAEVEEGEEPHRQINFVAASHMLVNPLHFDGVESPVICLGNGLRPVFSCPDASPLFARPSTRFYALLGDDLTNKSVFLDKAIAGDGNYQIFAVQNFDEEGEKKRV